MDRVNHVAQVRRERAAEAARIWKQWRDQVIGILAEHEAGAKCADLCRKNGMSEGTFYNWKAKFGGVTVSKAKRLNTLGYENGRLKKLLAEQMLDLAAMNEPVAKKC